jgi:hypothetical protein
MYEISLMLAVLAKLRAKTGKSSKTALTELIQILVYFFNKKSFIAKFLYLSNLYSVFDDLKRIINDLLMICIECSYIF